MKGKHPAESRGRNSHMPTNDKNHNKHHNNHDVTLWDVYQTYQDGDPQGAERLLASIPENSIPARVLVDGAGGYEYAGGDERNTFEYVTSAALAKRQNVDAVHEFVFWATRNGYSTRVAPVSTLNDAA